MTADVDARERFGCEQCCPAEPEAAWEARRGLARVAELVDESHFHVMILACDGCGQRFVSVFTERIDWVDGDDPQHSMLLPLTPEEADGLAQAPVPLSEARLNALGPGRRCLIHDYPKGGPARTAWGAGMWVGPHD